MSKRARLIVTGDVQGVGFRYHTQSTARALGVRGYVRNLSSGEVEIVAEGEAVALEQLIDWAHRGPPSARVDDVQIEMSDATGEFDRFEVRP